MTTVTTPRYDGHAAWYDDFNRDSAAANAVELAEILGPGDGLCLDLGCGTGLYLDMIRATGRTPIGIDFSPDQLSIARTRETRIIRGDAARLPFPDGTFRTVTTFWISTDVDDFAAVLTEAARVLEPGGTLLFSGVHPCFNGPHIQLGTPELGGEDARLIHPTYRVSGWHTEAPWWGYNIRRRVGMRHVPLAEFLNAFAGAGFVIDHAVESERMPIPFSLTIRAHR